MMSSSDIEKIFCQIGMSAVRVQLHILTFEMLLGVHMLKCLCILNASTVIKISWLDFYDFLQVPRHSTSTLIDMHFKSHLTFLVPHMLKMKEELA